MEKLIRVLLPLNVQMPTYIMTEYLFKQLCQVQSFNEANGANYQEHIPDHNGRSRDTQGTSPTACDNKSGTYW